MTDKPFSKTEVLRFIGAIHVEKLPHGTDLMIVSPTEAVMKVMKLLDGGWTKDQIPESLKKEAAKGVCFLRNVDL